MNNLEKLIALAMLFGQPIFIFMAIMGAGRPDSPANSVFNVALPVIGALSLATVFITIRDMYKRDFENPNFKLNWILVFSFTGGIGLIFYLYKHGFKPRTSELNI